MYADVGDILTAEYITKLLGVATVRTNSISKTAGFDGNFTYGMENIGTSVRNLMNPDELLKLDNNMEIIIERGRKPIKCKKYDYSKHEEAYKLEDLTIEEQKEKFKENFNSEIIQKKVETIDKRYSFKDF